MEAIKGKYRIVREIARSNDIVYEAVDTTLGRRIALKELNIAPSLTGQARRERIERFNREARAAGRLGHPNIVSVFDFGEDNGRHFIAMEFLEGQTLRDKMQLQGALPLKEALTIACQILDALGYAHTNHVIHRDIKPDNIHILPGGQVKLTDFGIARLTEEVALTGDGQVFGTPSYMSPEQIVGREIDYRTDLFSLAVVLYEMLSGRKPFTGDSVVSITYAIMHATPGPMTGIPPAIEQVILRALAKDPNGRYASAEQMKRELMEAEQRPVTFLPPSVTGSGGGFGYHGTGVPVPPPFQTPASYGGSSGGMSGGYGGGASGGYAPLPAQAPPLGDPNAPLPWRWNNSGAGGNAAPAPPSQYPAAMPPPMAPQNGAYPYGQPPYARPAPIFTLSPGARTVLLTILVGILLGGGIAGGVIAFMRSYEQFRSSASAQRIAELMGKGVDAYNTGDFAAAAGWFEKALDANPRLAEREKVIFNLAASDNQLARAAAASGNWAEAKTYYGKALTIAPDNQVAHNGLADALERLGETGRAREERAAARSSAETGGTPASLSNLPVTGEASGQDSQQFLEDRRAAAQQLIEEGDALYRQGDAGGARQKWQEAVGRAPGTPERDAAMQRIEQVQTTPNFDGG